MGIRIMSYWQCVVHGHLKFIYPAEKALLLYYRL